MAFFELLLNRVSLEYSEVLNDELRDWGKALRIFFFFFTSQVIDSHIQRC